MVAKSRTSRMVRRYRCVLGILCSLSSQWFDCFALDFEVESVCFFQLEYMNLFG